MKSFFLVLAASLFSLSTFAQDDFIADTENGYKDLQLGKTIKELQAKVKISELNIKVMRPDVKTYRVEDTSYLTREGFSFGEVQLESNKEKLSKITWIRNNTDTLFFNSLLENINTKYGEFQRTIHRGFQVFKQWYFEFVVIEMIEDKLPNGHINVRLSFSLRKGFQ